MQKLSRRILPASAAGLFFLSCLAPIAAAAATAVDPERPNILFLLSDDQRNDTLGCAGHPIIQTPILDSLAAGGVRFRNAFVTTSICAASRASILTGLHERTHGYTFRAPPISEQHMLTSYPALLREAGYRTGFIGKYGVQGKATPERLFDFWEPLKRSPYFKKQADGTTRHVTELSGDRAIDFLRSHAGEQPFCLSISFNAGHAEDGDLKDHYPSPRATQGMYEAITIPAPRLSDPAIFESQPDFLKNSINRERYFWRWDTPEKYQKNMRGYFRMISGIDRVIGRIREELENLGLADNTVIIYLGDNGYYMGDRGFAGKWSHYEQSLRVPLIVHDPRMPEEVRGTVPDEIALNIDVAATMLELAGAELPEHYQGNSLVPLLQGRTVPGWRRDFFCEHLMDHPKIPKWEGVRATRYVYARYFEQDPGSEFLHDLETDPDQLLNLAPDPDHGEILARMRLRCEELKERHEGPTATAQ